MWQTPFHAYYAARELDALNNDSLLPAFASSDVSVYPYQIAAANFVLHAQSQRGVILCDEPALGKTYEALIIAAQLWYQGMDRQILILPPNLIHQWTEKLEKSFTLPYILIDSEEKYRMNGGFDQSGLVVTTYDFALSHADEISSIQWDLAIFDEAGILSKSYTLENKTANTLKSSTSTALKLLLTPTPITMSIMDIYGLIHFIDENALPDKDEFYKRYFRKPERYPELTDRVSKYAFRTLKRQVTDYVGFSRRIPYVMDYALTVEETSLYKLTEHYLSLPVKSAYPKMETYELNLMFYHTLSSSPKAFCKMLQSPILRLGHGTERNLLIAISEAADNIKITGKIRELFSAIKRCFAKFKQLKIPQKALIFTDNLTTQNHLSGLLSPKYGVLSYSGANSRDFSIIDRFRSDKTIQILLATDDAVRGLDIEFCPLVINYDLIYNALEIEQRISRCHRQGQESDVLVINLLSKENFSDVRILELINKRVLQFDGIFGMSDAIVGNFHVAIEEVINQIRPVKEVKESFKENLSIHEPQNRRTVTHAEDVLFTTFTKSVADKVTVTPQYIADKSAEINAQLWELTKLFFRRFNTKNGEIYDIDDKTQTVTALCKKDDLPRLFYYWTKNGSRPYKSLKSYGMAKDFKPHSGRITLTSILARGILQETACSDKGTIMIDSKIEPCRIGMYTVKLSLGTKENMYNVLVGQTESGNILSDEKCKSILNMPVKEYSNQGDPKEYWLRNSTGGNSGFDKMQSLIPVDALKNKFTAENSEEKLDEIERIKLKYEHEKTKLNRSVAALKDEAKKVEKKLENSPSRVTILKVKKQLAGLRQELGRKEEALFFEEMELEQNAENEIQRLQKNENLKADILKHFEIIIVSSE